MKKVGIVMGSDSDLPVIKKATDQLAGLGIPFEAHVYSAHRTPAEARDFALNARKNGFGVIIAAAGMAAHLAGAIAANTTLPVIGIPCQGPVMDGLDALLSTVQMPGGDGGGERRSERGAAGGPDPGRGRRGPGGKAGREAREGRRGRTGKGSGNRSQTVIRSF